MRHATLLFLAFLLPTALTGQRTCSVRPTTDHATETLVYQACATDRPARFLRFEIPFRYPEVLNAAGILPTTDPVVVLTIDSMGRPLPSSVAVVAVPNHAALRNAIIAAARGWRFLPALREGRPVASMDSVRIRLLPPPAPLVPRDCTHCDQALEAARRRALEAISANARCAEAISTVMAWDIPDADAWAFELAPTCPGAADAAEVTARLAAHRYSNGIGPARWVEFASRVRSPGAFEFALQAARLGHRFAFVVLAFQATGTAARVPDSLPVAWDQQNGLPTRDCGIIRIFERRDSTTATPMDSAAVNRAVRLADSLVSADRVDPTVRASAWCLANQLR